MSGNILIAGIGGQGTLLASRVLGRLFLNAGYDVKVSEVHGMSQRGGSVVSYVRYGERVFSPVIDKGEADAVIAFELLEAARWAEYLKQGGTVVVNCERLDPVSTASGAASYPEDIPEGLSARGFRVHALDGLALAREAGSERAVNFVLLGRASRLFDIPKDGWMRAIEQYVPRVTLDANKKAFEFGRGTV